MTKQEVNEFLAEKLFGLERNVDFGEIEHEWQSDFIGWSCKNCGEQSDEDPELSDFYGQETCYKQAPDYISDYHPVLEKLYEDKLFGSIALGREYYQKDKFKYYCQIKGAPGWFFFDAYGLEIGESICRAMVEYLKGEKR